MGPAPALPFGGAGACIVGQVTRARAKAGGLYLGHADYPATHHPPHFPPAMKQTLHLVLGTVLLLGATGCYHARVETGLTPGARVIDKPWALSFVYGLIPPPAVNGAAECGGGVAIVETELSFLNSLVSILTGGIVTPMHIMVTCASDATGMLGIPHREITAPAELNGAGVSGVIARAADLAARTEQPVVVRFAD